MMANAIYLLLIEYNSICPLLTLTVFKPPYTQIPQRFKTTALHARSSHKRLDILLLGGRPCPLPEDPIVGVFRGVLSEDDSNDGLNTCPWKVKEAKNIDTTAWVFSFL